DSNLDLYYGICDNRGKDPEEGVAGRLYTLGISITPEGIRGVRVVGMTLLDADLETAGVQPYGPGEVDAEEVLLTPDGRLIISSERDLENRPWIRIFSQEGELLGEIPVPEKFMPGEGVGVRRNLAFEAMALSPDGKTLFVATEQALAQDGPICTTDHGTTVRIIQYDLTGETPAAVAEYPYVTEPIFASPLDTYADNGVTAMVYIKHILPEYDLLVVERAYVSGVGNDIKVFGVKIAGADDVKDIPALPFPFTGNAVEKTLLLRISALPEYSDIEVEPDNIEAICLGPTLPSGNPSLILASDNNFNPHQRNLFLLFELVP
ncbi:MAG TPA: esterase-like activity of phytase family protein, partial [Candidatus Acetothermia bacterium]|nr:esterase-like activity of phytase family protein [Candidatus Acetothermia bacterium]